MKDGDILNFVEQIYLDRKIEKETIFCCIEDALAHAASTSTKPGEHDDSAVEIHIDRSSGRINAYRDGLPLSQAEITARVGAQIARQVIMQKIREAELNMIYDEYIDKVGQLVYGEVRRNERNVTIVSLPLVEAILPSSEKIPRETFRNGTRICALIIEVKKNGNKVKVVLSRNRSMFVRRLYERDIPEINDGTLAIKGVEREAGKRTKICVESHDPHVDVIGACLGKSGARSRGVIEELGGGERIDVVVWDADESELIRNALRPAEVLEVMLCPRIGRAIVLVEPTQRSLAIGRAGQNVRLASLIAGWDIEIMTKEDLDMEIENATKTFLELPYLSQNIAEALVGEGFLHLFDLECLEPSDFVKLSGLTEEQAGEVLEAADAKAEEEEIAEKEREKQEREMKLAQEKEKAERTRGQIQVQVDVPVPSDNADV